MRIRTLLAASLLPAIAAGELLEFDHECETALALSAGPEGVREGAAVYLLGDEGYERTRPSSNGFHCLVTRNHEQSVIPQCFDAASKDANLRLFLEEGEKIRAGATFAEIAAWREERLAAGYPTANRPGLVYMISNYNYIWGGESGRMLKVAPHVMFHAPNLASADIGAGPREAFGNTGMPFITAEGPHGFMTSFVEKSSDSSAVEAACAGQLPPREAMVPLPPPSD